MVDKNITNIGTMMSALKITSRTLAEMLNIHYSLVSKWINGRRPLNHNSSYLKQITAIFMNIDEPHNYSIIKHLLADAYPNVELSSRDNISLYLSNYLATDTSEMVDLTSWDKVDRSKINSRVKCDVYNGPTGRQAASVRLVKSANSLPRGQEIIVFGNEPIEWQRKSGNNDYFEIIKQEHTSFLNNGGHITILHSISRSDKELVQSLFYWLPIHHLKRTNAYYTPDYIESPIRVSVSAIRGKATFFGFSTYDGDEPLTTLYSTDINVVKKMESIFDSYKSNSMPLFEETSSKDASHTSLEFSARRSNAIMFSTLPFQYCFDNEIFRELLNENNVDLDAEAEATIFYELDQKRLFNSLSTHSTQLMMNLESLYNAINNGTYLSFMNWIFGKDIWASPEIVKKACKQLCNNAELYMNLHLTLVNDTQISNLKNTTLLVKENTSFITNTTGQTEKGPLTIKEPTIVSAIYKYLEGICKGTPKPYREKDSVIEIIRNI